MSDNSMIFGGSVLSPSGTDIYLAMSTLAEDGGSTDSPVEIFSLKPGGDLVVADWGIVRRRAKQAHEAAASGNFDDAYLNAHCALIWAAANPGVQP